MRTIGRRLVKWYGKHARDLPWRTNPTPYRVLVSEVMLQQTVVGTVLAYFERWLERFPNPEALAAAGERDVLTLWEGMGYYRRALRLREAAGLVMAEYGGRIPSDRAALRRLPGVGPYIAAAVLSFAFGQDVAAVDANAVRVFMRLTGMDGTGREAAVKSAVRECAEAGLPPGHSSAFNQGVMDFGSLICRPRRPRCDECFLRDRCAAFRAGRQYDVPRPTRRRLTKIRTSVALFLRDGCVYLQKRPPGGLFAGMWEFPGGKAEAGETSRAALVRECREELGIDCVPGRRVARVVHYYTVFEITLHAYRCEPPVDLPLDRTHRWVALGEIGDYPMPSASRRIITELTSREYGRR